MLHRFVEKIIIGIVLSKHYTEIKKVAVIVLINFVCSMPGVLYGHITCLYQLLY